MGKKDKFNYTISAAEFQFRASYTQLLNLIGKMKIWSAHKSLKIFIKAHFCLECKCTCWTLLQKTLRRFAPCFCSDWESDIV